MILYTYNEKHNDVFTYYNYRQIIYSTGGQNTKGKFEIQDNLCTHVSRLNQLLQNNKYIQKSNKLPEDLLFVTMPFL